MRLKENLQFYTKPLDAAGVPWRIASGGSGRHHTRLLFTFHGVEWSWPMSTGAIDYRGGMNSGRAIQRVLEGKICRRCQFERIEPPAIHCRRCAGARQP